MSADRVKWCENGVIPTPGTCAICGYAGHGQRRFAIVGVHIKYYGNVIFCESCVNTIAHLPGLNFVSQKKLDEAIAEKEQYRGKLDTLRDELIDTIVTSVRSLAPEHPVSGAVAKSDYSQPGFDDLVESDSNAVGVTKKSLGLFD